MKSFQLKTAIKSSLMQFSNSWKKIAVTILIIFGLIGTPILLAQSEANFQTGEKINISEISTENLYVSGEEVTITADSEKDLLAAGGVVRVTGDVGGNLVVAGGQVLIEGDVTGDVFLAGGNVIVNGDVLGDLRAAGGEIYINSEEISGDLILAGGTGGVNQDIIINGSTQIELGEESIGNLPNELTELRQTYDYSIDSATVGFITAIISGVSIAISILVFLGSILAGYFLFWLFPTFTEKQIQTIETMPVKSLGFGLVTYILAPILGIILGFSIIGWPILWILIILGTLASNIGNYYVSYVVGKKTLTMFGLKKPKRILSLSIGLFGIGFITLLLAFIPFLGWFVSGLISTAINMTGVGAIILTKTKHMKLRGEYYSTAK